MSDVVWLREKWDSNGTRYMLPAVWSLMGAKVFADADDIITFWSVYQLTYVEVLVLVILSAPQTVTSTFPNESA